MHVIGNDGWAPLRPADIDVSTPSGDLLKVLGGFVGLFGNKKVDQAAKYLVLLARKNHCWAPIPVEKIAKSHLAGVNELASDGQMVLRDGKYYFTTEFIGFVWGNNPADHQ